MFLLQQSKIMYYFRSISTITISSVQLLLLATLLPLPSYYFHSMPPMPPLYFQFPTLILSQTTSFLWNSSIPIPFPLNISQSFKTKASEDPEAKHTVFLYSMNWSWTVSHSKNFLQIIKEFCRFAKKLKKGHSNLSTWFLWLIPASLYTCLWRPGTTLDGNC